MQDNEPLMRALAKLVTVNNPDKIVFVGEALVGNEAVDQLSKFDRSLKDFSAAAFGVRGKARGIDGMILTKFDTIVSRIGRCSVPLEEDIPTDEGPLIHPCFRVTGRQGRRGPVHDLHHGSTDLVCGVRTDL